MKLKFCVLFLTGIIFFIRLFWKDSNNIFNENIAVLFKEHISKIIVYLYQALVIIYIYYVKKNNAVILSILLLINLFLITCYCIRLT